MAKERPGSHRAIKLLVQNGTGGLGAPRGISPRKHTDYPINLTNLFEFSSSCQRIWRMWTTESANTEMRS